jgi:hypothetical protein
MDDNLQNYASETNTAPPSIDLTSTAQAYLNQTRPWTRFVSVIMFIFCGLLIVASLAAIVVGVIGGFASSGSMGPGMPFAAMGMIPLGLFYMVLAIISYLIPGIFLTRYASAIRFLEGNPSAEALEDALKHQKSFWRYVGILLLIFLILMILAIAGAIVFAILAASSGFKPGI